MTVTIQLHRDRQLVSWIGYWRKHLAKILLGAVATKADVMHLPIGDIALEMEAMPCVGTELLHYADVLPALARPHAPSRRIPLLGSAIADVLPLKRPLAALVVDPGIHRKLQRFNRSRRGEIEGEVQFEGLSCVVG